MAQNAPGKHFRKGLSLAQLFTLFPDDDSAEAWFVNRRWPDGVRCPHCDCDNIQDGARHKTQRYRCRGCRRRFSARTDTILADSNIGFRDWLVAIYLMTTGLKGLSSMKLHRDLGVTQKTAWFMQHRIRKAWAEGSADPFLGPVEADETFVGGKARNMSASRRREVISGRGPVGKVAVVGVKDRASGKVAAQPVPDTSARTLVPFVASRTEAGAEVYTDEHSAYKPLASLGYCHAAVAHSAREYARGDVSTNGIESLWSMFKRGYIGTYHHMSEAHLHRYVDEFTGRHNIRPLDTLEQMGSVVAGMVGKRLRYDELIAA
ncbi:MAG: IS1595 family transposase [Gemmatimonadetes bacterium]|nr:IS1595 family transposase [Gemmatimonadota bacterium]